ncbi:OCIA domain-containing protein 1-like Protein [Elysia marginata]|uniref:OCIA domain-containing protein 1-like Protein n=1 Tax=Elysia marginata TaxID=1093978 RepID=A0AAV4GX93_9GAST|nr:OCIA domain-containing protein 1-like Protein [Elysia marginata]
MTAQPQPNVGGPQFQHDTSATAPQQSLGAPGQMPVLTDEERQIMKECERDSFYQRALPISFGCMIAAQGLVRSGYWNSHPRYGAFPKMIITGGVGYFIGKIMYLPKCQQKILEKLPNSNLANAIRKSKGIPQPEPSFPAGQDGFEDGFKAKTKLSDDYSALEGLDDRNRPSIDREVKVDNEDKEEKKVITYDDLRRRNRQEYEDNMAKRPARPPGSPSYKDSPFMPQQPWPDKSKQGSGTEVEIGDSSPPPSQAPSKRKRTNIWGDPIDE